MEHSIAFAGRICLALIFLLAAYGKFSMRQFHLDAMKQVGVPLPALALPLTTVLDLGGALLIMSGTWLRYIVPTMVVYVALCTIFFYSRWFQKGKFDYMTSIEFTKNVALIGGLLLLIARDFTQTLT
ncbi:Uncharacterized membrane protein YphA, DoxX/SURF4 family [Burkholderia sp. OK233]|nr:Uncharacterized membrane protein YphA, DoxX/SURF4 family [Burkholderia sp. OK233]